MSKAMEMLLVGRLTIMALRMNLRSSHRELAEALDPSSEWIQPGVHPQEPLKEWKANEWLDKMVAWVYDSVGVPIPVTKREVMMMNRIPNGEAVRRRMEELSKEIEERIQINCAWNDEFNFLNEKGIEIELLEGEASVEMGWKDAKKVESLEAGMREIKGRDMRKLSTYAVNGLKWEYKSLLDEWKSIQAKYESIGRAIDKKMASKRYEEATVELWGDTRDEVKAINYLVHYVPKWTDEYGFHQEYIEDMERDLALTSGDNIDSERIRGYWPEDMYCAEHEMNRLRPRMTEMLLKAKNRIFDCRKKWSYDLYVKAMLIVLKELSEKLGADTKLYEKFLSMQFQLQSVNGASVREESTASMHLSMEDAIDIKRSAERLAERHRMSVEEAFLMMQAEREGIDVDQHIFLVEMAEEDVQNMEEGEVS